MEQLRLAIDGMSCGHCVGRVTQTLAAVQGVRVDDVSVGAAVVSYDTAVTTAEKITSAVSAAGYPAHVAGAAAAAR